MEVEADSEEAATETAQEMLENGELTNTLKTRRPVIIKNYAAVIEKMYEE